MDNSTLRLGEEIGGVRKETAEFNSRMTRLTKSMDNMEPTVATHSTELMKLNGRMDKMETGEGVQTMENGARQTRKGTTVEPSEVAGEWCPNFITLAGWVTDWKDPEKRTKQLITTDLARKTHRAAHFNNDARTGHCTAR